MLTGTTHARADAAVVRLSGVLDVIVDIHDLEVRDEQSWAVSLPAPAGTSRNGRQSRSTTRWPPPATPSPAENAATVIEPAKSSARTHPA
jgi:hypothetical protein